MIYGFYKDGDPFIWSPYPVWDRVLFLVRTHMSHGQTSFKGDCIEIICRVSIKGLLGCRDKEF